MSQQNSEVKEHIISGKLIIGFIIFMLICIVITVIAIGYNKYQKQIQKNNISNNKSEKMMIKSLTERYKGNDLKILNEEEHIGASRDAQWENDHNITKLNFYYVQIKGLKEKVVENKINEEIKQEVTKWYKQEELHDANIDYVSIDAYVYGNFGNAISIRITKYANYVDDWKIEMRTLNFDLTTGKKIQFSDLFLPGVSIKNILSQALYDYYITQTGYSSDTEDFNKVDLSQIENKVYNTMSIYNNNPEIDTFNFSSSYIFLKIGDIEEIVIDNWKYYDKIAIFHRFETEESIFDGEYPNNAESFVLMEIEPEDYLINKQIASNLIQYMIINVDYDAIKDSRYKQIYDEYMQKINSEIEEYKKEAEKNPDETIIYMGYFSLYKGYVSEELSFYLPNHEICEYMESRGTVKMATQYYKDELFKDLYSNGLNIIGLTYNENENVKVDIKEEEYRYIDVNTKRELKDILEEMLSEEINKIEQHMENEQDYSLIDETEYYQGMLYVIQNQYEIYFNEKDKAEFQKKLDGYYDRINKVADKVLKAEEQDVLELEQEGRDNTKADKEKEDSAINSITNEVIEMPTNNIIDNVIIQIPIVNNIITSNIIVNKAGD